MPAILNSHLETLHSMSGARASAQASKWIDALVAFSVRTGYVTIYSAL